MTYLIRLEYAKKAKGYYIIAYNERWVKPEIRKGSKEGRNASPCEGLVKAILDAYLLTGIYPNLALSLFYSFSTISLFLSILIERYSSGLNGKELSSTKAFSK